MRFVLASLVLSLTVACGGGGGSNTSVGSPPPPVVETAPNAEKVSGLTLNIVNPNRIELAWLASAGAVKYQVLRTDQASALTEVTSTTYADTTVQPGLTYTYQIRAFNRLGAGSVLSDPITGMIPSVTPVMTPTTPTNPTATTTSTPTNLTATATSPQSIRLTWDTISTVTGSITYTVFRSDKASLLAQVALPQYDDLSVSPATTYSYRVQAIRIGENASDLSPAVSVRTPNAVVVTPVADTTPPSTPLSLQLQSPSATRINLSWTASTDNVAVTKYQIVRQDTAGILAETATTTYSDATVAANTSYTYQVRAVDAANNLSAWSLAASIRTAALLDSIAPSAPTNLSATAASASLVNLNWTASTDNVGVTKYQIFKAGVAGIFAETSAITYADTSVTGGMNYSYQVKALDAANNASSLSNVVTVTTPSGLLSIAELNPLFNVAYLASNGFQDLAKTTATADNQPVRVIRDVIGSKDLAWRGINVPSPMWLTPPKFYQDEAGGYILVHNVLNTQWVSTSFAEIPQPYDVYLVVRDLEAVPFEAYMSGSIGLRNRGNFLEVGVDTGPTQTNASFNPPRVLEFNKRSIIRIRADGVNSGMWINGVAVAPTTVNLGSRGITLMSYGTNSHAAQHDFYGMWVKFGTLNASQHQQVYDSLAQQYKPGTVPNKPFASNIRATWTGGGVWRADYQYVNTNGLAEDTSRTEFRWGYRRRNMDLDTTAFLPGVNARNRTLKRSDFPTEFAPVGTGAADLFVAVKVFDTAGNSWEHIVRSPVALDNIP